MLQNYVYVGRLPGGVCARGGFCPYIIALISPIQKLGEGEREMDRRVVVTFSKSIFRVQHGGGCYGIVGTEEGATSWSIALCTTRELLYTAKTNNSNLRSSLARSSPVTYKYNRLYVHNTTTTIILSASVSRGRSLRMEYAITASPLLYAIFVVLRTVRVLYTLVQMVPNIYSISSTFYKNCFGYPLLQNTTSRMN